MPIPAPPAQHALALAPVDIVSATPSLTGAPLGRALDTTLRVRSAALNVLDGRAVNVAGTLSPGLAGRTIDLQALGSRGWSTVAQTHTGAGGRFRVRYRPHETGTRPTAMGTRAGRTPSMVASTLCQDPPT